MKYRRIISMMSALAMLALSAGCGQSDAGTESTPEIAVTTENTEQAAVVSAAASDEVSGTTTASAKAKSGKSTTTAASTSATGSSTTTAKTGAVAGNGTAKTASATASSGSSSGSSSSGSASGSSGSGSSSSSGGGSSSSSSSSGESSPSGSASTTATASSGGASAVTTAAASQSPASETPAEPETPETPADEGYTAKVSLSDSPAVSGSGVSVSGSSVTITQSGDYYLTGSLSDGQVLVEAPAEEKVKLILDGVDITCTTGPAILINNAKKCTIELADGSSNYLTDSAKDDVNNGVIFSNDTLRIKGSGSLEITANNAHGIASDDDVIIESGTYVINSKKSGIFAHDDITIKGGDLTIFGGTNGIKSKGTLNMNGGRAVVSGGTKEEKSSVYAYSAFNYTGGELYAAGNQVTAPATSVNPYIVLDLSTSPAAAGSELSLYLDGYEAVSFNPHNSYRCVIMLSPDIADGSSFSADIDGSSVGNFTVSDIQNVFKAE
ncbi:MAG: carbohydrate-binding domain-containing protein [Ruminococcus sp.]|nr:carbohydrate-binding domain-containing protein [Ruminococcus sp.]